MATAITTRAHQLRRRIGVDFLRRSVWTAVGHRRVGKPRDEFLNRRLRIGADLLGVGADEAAREDAARQAGDVVALERLERAHRELGGVGDVAQSDAALFAQPLHPLAEVALGIQRSAMLGPGLQRVKRARDALDSLRERVGSAPVGKQADRRHAGGAGARHQRRVVGGHAANREHGHACVARTASASTVRPAGSSPGLDDVAKTVPKIR